MSSKNALLFFLAVFGVLFIGGATLFSLIPGFSVPLTALYTIGGFMLVLFLALVLGVGFILKLVYLGGTVTVVSHAAKAILASDWIMAAVFAVVSMILLFLIPKIFLKK